MKRFTETTKWADPWFRKLPPHLKCLWLYLCDNCDGAGVIDLDMDLVSFQVGHEVTVQDLQVFSDRISRLDSGKLWLKKFIPFQYGKLSVVCKPHASVIALVKSHGLNPDEMQRVCKGYAKSIDTPQEKDKDKEEEKEQEKDRQDPCTEDEAWNYARNLAVSPSWTQHAVAKWFATRQRDGWQTGGMHPKTITSGTWRHDLRASHSWATTGQAPAKKSGPFKPQPMLNTV